MLNPPADPPLWCVEHNEHWETIYLLQGAGSGRVIADFSPGVTGIPYGTALELARGIRDSLNREALTFT